MQNEKQTIWWLELKMRRWKKSCEIQNTENANGKGERKCFHENQRENVGEKQLSKSVQTLEYFRCEKQSYGIEL